MAKGRKLTSSRSERLLGSYTQAMTPMSHESSDLAEEDIWSMVDDSVDREWNPRGQTIEISTSARRKDRREHVGGLSLAFEDPSAKAGQTTSSRIVHHHQFRTNDSTGSGQMKRGGLFKAASLPVNVPDWSKIYRVDSAESMHDSDEWVEEEEFESEMIPPHEYLARSRSQAATSVFEGVGRTLKGRDLSRVRDAVWSQTGFDG
uniref:Senescence regulator n=1 Tax=Kalanchoe fedtschenkoi TaxID=63787 RepID=A0A7N0RF88_KALFE